MMESSWAPVKEVESAEKSLTANCFDIHERKVEGAIATVV